MSPPEKAPGFSRGEHVTIDPVATFLALLTVASMIWFAFEFLARFAAL